MLLDGLDMGIALIGGDSKPGSSARDPPRGLTVEDNSDIIFVN
jgi:hypothetical protein